MPLGLFSQKPSTYRITGGLFQDFAPSAFHLKYVLFPILKEMGANLDLEIIQAEASLAIWAKTDTGCLIGSDMAGEPRSGAEFIGSQVAKNLDDLLRIKGMGYSPKKDWR